MTGPTGPRAAPAAGSLPAACTPGWPARPGTVGLPLPGVSVRLAAGSGADSGPGSGQDSGEAEVRGPNVFAGYWQRPQATAAAFTADGWFRTGDIGELSADGYLRLVGRATELIITGGLNVYPREVEYPRATSARTALRGWRRSSTPAAGAGWRSCRATRWARWSAPT
jgi:long-subunit acyl-CoA synthetase (AMP-forming)